MPRIVSFLICTLVLLSTRNAIAIDHPRFGIINNIKEPSSITYNCSLNDSNILECDITYLLISNKTEKSNLPKKLDETKKKFLNNKNALAKTECSDIKLLKDIIDGKKTAPNRDAYKNMSEVSKSDLSTMINLMLNICSAETLENYLALAKFEHNKGVRTCSVFNNSFKLKFRKLNDNNIWVSDIAPYGICGLISVSRFIPEVIEIAGKPSVTMWNYETKKTITNPNGVIYNKKCQDYFQDSDSLMEFNWHLSEKQISCDYIEFM